MESPNYMTPEGADKLRAELKKLLEIDRPEVVKTVSWAASNGDRSENGDYIYGKKRLREIDRRIRFLTKRLDSVVIVDPKSQGLKHKDRVVFGASVHIQMEDGRTPTYQIVGIDEADAGHGRISWISPLAKVLLNRTVGDVVELKLPSGESQEIEILGVTYR